MAQTATLPGDTSIYVLGSILGIGAGILDVKVGDLLLTAMFVLASTMLLGALRPERPWRWILCRSGTNTREQPDDCVSPARLTT